MEEKGTGPGAKPIKKKNRMFKWNWTIEDIIYLIYISLSNYIYSYNNV
jgi:hypothetical protein